MFLFILFQARRFLHFGFQTGVFIYAEMVWIRCRFGPIAANLVPLKKFRVWDKYDDSLPDALSLCNGALGTSSQFLQQTPEPAVVCR